MEILTLFHDSQDVDAINFDINTLYKRLVKDQNDKNLLSVIDECFLECKKAIFPKASYMLLNVKPDNSLIDFEAFSINSKALSDNLSGCKNCILFGATLGAGLDRIISKYSLISPLKSLICQNIGSEYIENYCDYLCDKFKKDLACFTKPRFSPGYMDLDLFVQKDIFDLLKLSKHCGITLTESLIMRPSKSVTAFLGLSDKPCENPLKCSLCDKKNCEYRLK